MECGIRDTQAAHIERFYLSFPPHVLDYIMFVYVICLVMARTRTNIIMLYLISKAAILYLFNDRLKIFCSGMIHTLLK